MTGRARRRGQVKVLTTLARHYHEAGDRALWRDHLGQAAKAYEEAGDTAGAADMFRSWAVGTEAAPPLESQAAAEFLERAIRLYASVGMTAGQVSALRSLSEVYTRRGDGELAEEAERLALALGSYRRSAVAESFSVIYERSATPPEP